MTTDPQKVPGRLMHRAGPEATVSGFAAREQVPGPFRVGEPMREDRTKPLCGRCGGSGYVTDPPGADVNVEGVAVMPCPRCR